MIYTRLFDSSQGVVCYSSQQTQILGNFKSGVWPYFIFVSNKHLHVVLDGEFSQKCPVSTGFLQGSILGPTLFFPYYTLMISLMIFVILLFMLMIQSSTLNVIKHLICDNN